MEGSGPDGPVPPSARVSRPPPLLSAPVPSFDPVVDAYEAARPAYPDGVFDLLGPLSGLRVLEGGAGTGLATRPLRARGAEVVAVDIGEQMLRRNRPPCVVADAARGPFRGGWADLVCFGQAWHWLDHTIASAEMARALRDGGRWAAWWSHPRADGEPWAEAYWSLIESMTGAHRSQRDTNWGATIDTALFTEPVFAAVPWVREMSIDTWLTHERSLSYVGLSPDRDRILDRIEAIIRDAFGDGPARVPYETWIWTARKR